MRKLVCLAIATALAVSMTAAGELERGAKEVFGRFSYVNLDLGSASGVSVGEQENIEIEFAFGWLLSDNHELGLSTSYIKEDFSNSDIFVDSETDGSTYGGFYHFNFSTKGMATPFVGVNAAIVGGDVGDIYNFQYGAEAGVKIYPFEHGAVVVSVAYAKLQADEAGVPDADAISLGAGIILKFGGGK